MPHRFLQSFPLPELNLQPWSQPVLLHPQTQAASVHFQILAETQVLPEVQAQVHFHALQVIQVPSEARAPVQSPVGAPSEVQAQVRQQPADEPSCPIPGKHPQPMYNPSPLCPDYSCPPNFSDALFLCLKVPEKHQTSGYMYKIFRLRYVLELLFLLPRAPDAPHGQCRPMCLLLQ